MGHLAPLFSFLSTLLLFFCQSTVFAHDENRMRGSDSRLEGQHGQRLRSPGSPPQYYSQPSYAYDSPPPYVIVTSTSVSASASSEYTFGGDSTPQSTASTAAESDSVGPSNNASTTSAFTSILSVTVTLDTTVPLESSSSTAPWTTSSATASQTSSWLETATESSWDPSTASSTVGAETSATFITGSPSPHASQTVQPSAASSTARNTSYSESLTEQTSAGRDTSSEPSHFVSWNSLSNTAPETLAPSSSPTIGSILRLTITRVISVTNSVTTPETLSRVSASLDPDVTDSSVLSSSWSNTGTNTLPSPLSSLINTTVTSGTAVSGTQHGGSVSTSAASTMIASSSEWPSTMTTSSAEPFSTYVLPNVNASTLTISLTWTESYTTTPTSSPLLTNSNTSSMAGQTESETASALSTASTHDKSVWSSAPATGTPAGTLSSSSIRLITLTSTLVMTEPATAGTEEGSDPATESRGSSSSSVAAETGEDTESATGTTTFASPTDTVVTLSITSRVVRTTTSAMSASVVPQESESGVPIVSTLSTTSWSSSVTPSSSLSEATSQPSSPVSSTSSSFETYTYTSPRSPFPGASTSVSTDFTGNSSGPPDSATSGKTQGNDSAKLPFTTTGPSSGRTTVTAGSGGRSAPYKNSTSGTWITRTVVSSLFGTATTVGDSRTSNSSRHGSVDTVVKTLTLTIGASGAPSAVGSTDVGNSRTSVDGDPGALSTTSSGSSGDSSTSSASDATLSAHWTAGSSQFITRTITLTPPASSGSEHGSTWAPGSSSARFPLSWNSTMSRPTAGGSGWTRGVPSTWTNSTRVGTHNATVVKTLTRSIVLTLTQVPGFTTAEGSRSTLSDEATAQSMTGAGSTASGPPTTTDAGMTSSSSSAEATDFTKVASETMMNMTRVIFSKVTLTLESTITVGPSGATSSSSTASSEQGEAAPTDGGSTDGTSETTGRSTRWNTSMQTDGTCTDGLPLPYSSSEGIESTASCSAVVSGMETVTPCADAATTASRTAATATPESCASSMCLESDTDDALPTTWISSTSLVQPTTFETWATKREASLESQVRDSPKSQSPRARDSPVHRHLNVTELGHSIQRSRWVSKVAGRLKALLL